jgi:hypothetical protein
LFVSFQHILVLAQNVSYKFSVSNTKFLTQHISHQSQLLPTELTFVNWKPLEFHDSMQRASRVGLLSNFLYRFKIRENSPGFSTHIRAECKWIVGRHVMRKGGDGCGSGLCLIGYNTVYSVENQPTFRRNMSPSSGSKNKPSKEPA